ncbi:MAG: zinc metallopeptidase [Candidatus Latescibacteria bacterium]|nr:zinc metallopeptidase [Candidatus Latescibacterota bacterium]
MFFDSTFILVLPGLLLALWAQMKVKGTFSKYDRYDARSGMTADRVARDILMRGNLPVEVEHVSGNLSDHYDPRSQTLRLSDSTYGSPSLAAIGVAAHEAGHAFQHAVGYVPLSLRSNLVPVANFGSWLGMPLFFIGFFFRSGFLVDVGIVLFSFAVLFGLMTLPVEFNASKRAIRILADGGYLTDEEIPAARKVLDAAAWTYVASALVAVLHLLRLLILSGVLGGRDE